MLGGTNVHGHLAKHNESKPRLRSLTRAHERGTSEIGERMKYTVDFMKRGFKPNTRGHVIQDSFATLEELLPELPMSIGFSVEIKYPRIHEAVDAGVAPIAIEINTFVDETLDRIYRLGNQRSTILSSFTPEIYILLAIKQQTYLVMFITNASKLPMTDREMRASNLQSVVRFANRWNLSGIVFASDTFVLCPRLIRYVKESEMVCGSYGLLNNIPENIQQSASLDFIMTDRVGLIARNLGNVLAKQSPDDVLTLG